MAKSIGFHVKLDLYNSLTVSDLYSSSALRDPSDPWKAFSSLTTDEFSEKLKTDLWDFGYLWSYIQTRCPTTEELYAALRSRHESLRKLHGLYRPFIEECKRFERLYCFLSSLSLEMSENGNYLIDSSRLKTIDEGISGSYFLVDENGQKHFVIKPVDEDCGCMNNPKGFATPFDVSPICDDIPLYLSSLREALTYKIAQSIRVEQITPKTVLAMLESGKFPYLLDRVSDKEINRYLEECGPDLREKLCSVQEYVSHAKTLFEAQQELQSSRLSDEEIANRFDQRDFEDANLLIWTTYDTDAHANNILVYAKGTDSIGNEILGIKKIDNGLAFPDKNRELRNALAYLPNAKRPLSEEGRIKIETLDIERLSQELETYGLGSAVPALQKRLTRLKELAKQPEITLYQINKEMKKL